LTIFIGQRFNGCNFFQTTLIALVLVIGTRLDFFSVLYSAWLIPMFGMSRKQLQYKVWLPFIIFLAVFLPLQYISSVGIPPFLCVGKIKIAQIEDICLNF
jgi:hypothetical protein